MRTVPTNMTVGDYCNSIIRKEISVNRSYQRSDKVWPSEARSFLIETVILDYPMPKLSLHQITDLRSRKIIKEIVDGQQRSSALLDFYEGKYKLSSNLQTVELKGKKYLELDEEYQEKFIAYSLSIDLFTNTNEKEIREVFRRMNSYTIPLNNEEKRHSTYQGEFKWYIYDLTKKFDSTLINLGVFTEKQVSRMVDAKLFADISLALLRGIRTTNAKQLDDIYKDYDVSFPRRDEIESRIILAINFILNMPEIHKTSLMKPQVMYGLIIAISNIINPIEGLIDESLVDIAERMPRNATMTDRENIVANLTALAAALDDQGSIPKEMQSFVEATSRTTNEVRRRTTVFEWITRALSQPSLLQ